MKKKFFELFNFSRTSKVGLTLLAEVIIGIGFIAISLTIFLILADHVLDKETIFFDSLIINFVYLFRNPVATNLMKIITFFGSGFILGPAIFITIVALLKNHKKDAFIFAFILVLEIGLNLLLKGLFQRTRPTLIPLIIENSYSFPSGHAMNSFIFYISLSYFIFRNTINKKLGVFLTIFSLFLVGLIGLSRVYLGVHFPSDVFAGFLAGASWFVIVLLFEKTLIFLRLFRKFEVENKY